MVRYPQLRIAVHSRHPLVWVSGVRQALRRAGADRGEIRRFSDAALGAAEPEGIRRVCASWARVEMVGGGVAGREPG
jgi:hypothetical protein